MKRIAMWSGPRNISTAMMRSFENRADAIVVDEPLYACFLKATGIDHPGRDLILDNQSSDFEAIVKGLTQITDDVATVYYQKHMCHHLLQDMDRSWLDKVSNAFLIRDPRRMIASYVKSRESVTLDDLGILQQGEIFDRTADKLGTAPPVIESADVLRDPESMLTKLCHSLSVPFDSAMLNWPAGKRDSDGVWAPWWYASVEKSTGFMAYQDSTVTLPAELERLAEKCMPVYEKLLKYKL